MSTLKNDLQSINTEATACNVMVGIGETYLPAFVLALTGSQLACGLTATIPLLMGAVLQLAVPYGIRLLGSYRRWVVACAVLQALSFVPLIIASFTGSLSLVAVFFVIALYWATGQAGGTAWNAWMEDLVPQRVRARFFACRTRYAQAGIMLGFVVGGFALQFGHSKGYAVLPFALLFIGAVGSRFVSAKCLNSQSEGNSFQLGNSPKPWRDFFSITTKGGNGRIILYVLAAQLACYVSGPYFTPYILAHLKLSYLGYVALICAAYFAKVVTASTWGKVVKKIGVNRLLWMSGLAIAPLPALWDISDSFTYLMILQVYSGAVWAAFELANLLLILEAIPAAKKINVLTVYNFANALAIVGGSFIGGYLLTAFGGGRHAYLMLFLASTLARLAALLLLVKLPQSIPLFGRKKQALPARPVLAPSLTTNRPTLKPVAASHRVHVAHNSAPKPAFLRAGASSTADKDVHRQEDSKILAGKRV